MHARNLPAALALLTAVCAGVIAAAPLVNKSFLGNLAIDGYDVVAYFTDGKAVKGASAFSVERDGATYRFASAEHRELFLQDPEHYLPAYGGFCAWAVAQGDTAGVDPEAWTIFEGRLFLNYSKKIQSKWETDKAANIAKGDENWPKIVARKSR